MLKRLILTIVVVAFLFTFGATGSSIADPPGPIADAEATAQTLIEAALAAVIDITQNVTPSTVAVDSLAVSLLVGNDDAVRLISQRDQVLGGNNSRPRGKLEKDLLADALSSGIAQSGVAGNMLLTVVPLTNDALPGCAICHTDFDTESPGTNIGAILVTVPTN